jgi:hypothetical protein
MHRILFLQLCSIDGGVYRNMVFSAAAWGPSSPNVAAAGRTAPRETFADPSAAAPRQHDNQEHSESKEAIIKQSNERESNGTKACICAQRTSKLTVNYDLRTFAEAPKVPTGRLYKLACKVAKCCCDWRNKLILEMLYLCSRAGATS